MNSFNPGTTTNQIIVFLKKTFKDAGFGKAIVAVSGGVDSAVALTLTVKALGAQNVYALMLPYNDWHVTAVSRAQTLINHLKIPSNNTSIIDIAPMVDSYTSSYLSRVTSHLSLRLGNFMARMRMVVLFDQAKARKALVIGTENKSEHLLGYYTRFGDEASDIEPIRGLYKTQIFELARYLKVPQVILEARPTAGLWHGQTDEGEFGFSYAEADEILSEIYDKGKLPKDVVKVFSPELVKRVLQRVKDNEFKHHLPHIFDK